jgi:NitT/TauT family transport system ATP-binding protein
MILLTVLADAPMVAAIDLALRETQDGSLRADFFLDLLDQHFPIAEAERQFATAVDWGHYAELFEYNANEGRLTVAEWSRVRWDWMARRRHAVLRSALRYRY